MERTVVVWGRKQVVSVDQKSKSVWITSGNYMDQSIEVKGRSASSALALWRDAAKYKGN